MSSNGKRADRAVLFELRRSLAVIRGFGSLRAKLDALYFHLYGVTDRDDIRYVYSTFPIVERDEKAGYGIPLP